MSSDGYEFQWKAYLPIKHGGREDSHLPPTNKYEEAFAPLRDLDDEKLMAAAFPFDAVKAMEPRKRVMHRLDQDFALLIAAGVDPLTMQYVVCTDDPLAYGILVNGKIVRKYKFEVTFDGKPVDFTKRWDR